MFAGFSLAALATGMFARVGAPDNVSTDPFNPVPRRSYRNTQYVTDDVIRRRRNKRLWLEGKKVPAADQAALDAAQAERERKNARRAFMFRRQEEGVVLQRECAAYYARLNEMTGPKRCATHEECEAAGWDRIKNLLQLWDDRMPLEIVTGATAA